MVNDAVARPSSQNSRIARALAAALAAAVLAAPLRAQTPCLAAFQRFARPPDDVPEGIPAPEVRSTGLLRNLPPSELGTTKYSPIAHLEPSDEYVDELVRRLADPAARAAAACETGILAQMPITPVLARRLADAIAAARRESRADALDFAFAAVQLALEKPVAVLGDLRVALSIDPLVRYQQTKARFVAGDARTATDALRELVLGGDARVRLNLYWDVFPILSPADLEWARQGAPAPEALWRWLEGRAALSGFPLDDWLAEFYARLQHANVYYWGYSPHRAGTNPLRPLRRDPRREVYLRYGEPLQVVYSWESGSAAVSGDETWRYAPLARTGEPLLFHFTGVNFKIGLRVGGGCGRWAEDRATMSARIGSLFMACRSGDPFLTQRFDAYRLEMGNVYRAAFREYRHRAVRREWPFGYALYAFAADPARPARGTVVTAFLQVPANEDASGRGRVHLAIVDTLATHAWTSGGTIATGDAAAIETAIELPLDSTAAPHVYRISVRDDDDAAIAMAYGGPFTAPSFRDGVLAISDVVPLHPDGASPWRRGGEVLRPMLGAARGHALDIYYELYHLTPGEEIETVIRLERGGGLFRRARRYEVRFVDVVPDGRSVPTLAQRRTLQHDLGGGEYTLTVRVRSHATGTTVEKSIPIRIGG